MIKKTLTLLLAVILAVSMATMAFAANTVTKQNTALPDADIGEKAPGYEVWIPLTAASFDSSLLTLNVTMADVKSNKITVRQSVKSGAKAIDTVEIKGDANKDANIVLTLAKPFVSVDPVDFEVSLYLSIDGKRQGFETYVTGTLKNSETDIYESDDYVDLTEGNVAVCEENAKKVEADIGCGVSIFTKMTKGKSYYGIAEEGPLDSDDAILSEYPDIENVLRLTTINLNGAGNNVKINKDEDYFVYDSELNYLGKTSDMLPYSTKYYLSLTKLEIASVDEPDPDDPDPDAGEPIDETDNTPANNGTTDGNPDTGVTPLFGIAVVLGAVSLTTASAILVKKK